MSVEPEVTAVRFPPVVSVEVIARTEGSDPFTLRTTGPVKVVSRTICAFADAIEEWVER